MRFGGLALLGTCSLLASCPGPDTATCPGHTGDSGCPPQDDAVHCSSLAAINPHNAFGALVSVVCDADAAVAVEYGEGGAYTHRTPTVQVEADQPGEVIVYGLRADREHALRVVATRGEHSWTGPATTVHTAPLPEGWPACTVTAADGAPEPDLDEAICTNGSLADERPVYFCVDRSGEPVWELHPPDVENILHMQPLRNGEIIATAKSRSVVAHFDPAGRLLGEYTALWLEGRTRFPHQSVNHHDAIEITEGPWAGAVAFMTNHPDDFGEERRAGGGLIVLDLEQEEVIWDWSVHGELGDGLCIDPALSYDRRGQFYESENKWMHANALLHGVDPTDGKQYFWMSLRAQDWIVKIDPETDGIVWRLGYEGDFELVDDLDAAEPVALEPNLWMYQQHGPEWTRREGSRTRLLVFDNGNQRPDPLPSGVSSYTRVVELEIDEATMRATVVFSYGSYDPEDPTYVYSNGYGDADLLPGGDAVQAAFGYPFHDPTYLLEIGYPDGEERWRMTCPDSHAMFAVTYFPSLYDMTWWYDRLR